MRVTCPGCSSLYDVSDSLFEGRARRLRCSNCQHEWREDPPFGPDAPAWPEDAPHGTAAPERAPEPVAEPESGFIGLVAAARENRLEFNPGPVKSQAKGRSASDRLFLVLLVLLVALALILLGHKQIVHAIPASAGFFAAFGQK